MKAVLARYGHRRGVERYNVRFNLITDFVIELGETSSQLMRQLRRGRGRVPYRRTPSKSRSLSGQHSWGA
jgi:hypothetical protein